MNAIRKWATAVEAALLREDELEVGFPKHAQVVGSLRESRLATVLTRFLPLSLSVGRGQVIDLNGDRSGQLDLIIARNDVIRLPLVNSGDNIYFPESLFAAVEVKSRLRKQELVAALKTLRSAHLGFMAHTPEVRSQQRQRDEVPLSDDEVNALGRLTGLLRPSTYVYAYDRLGPRGFDGFCRMMHDAVMDTQIPPGLLPSVIAKPGAVAIRNDSVLHSTTSFGEEFLYAMRADNFPLYWILAHLTIRIIRTFGRPGLVSAPTEFVLEAHLDPMPEDWKLLKVTLADGAVDD